MIHTIHPAPGLYELDHLQTLSAKYKSPLGGRRKDNRLLFVQFRTICVVTEGEQGLPQGSGGLEGLGGQTF